MKLGYFSPLSPIQSGIAQYSEDLLPYLAAHARIDLYVDGYAPTNRDLTTRFPVLDYHCLNSRRTLADSAIPFYHVGNSPHHEYVYQTVQRFPGVTVLHDVVLHHLVVEMTIAKNNPAGYLREMLYCHGSAGADTARAVLTRQRDFPYLDYPLNRRVVDASLRVIVHSAYARSLVRTSGSTTDVDVVRLLAVPTATEPRRARTRAALGLTPNTVVFASIGLVTPAKRLQVALPAFRRVHQALPNSRFLIVGDMAPDADLVDIIARLGLHDCVLATGFVTRDQLDDYVAATDVGICLRWPTMGESSASALRFFGAAVPTIVSNVGSFAELPDDCCVKISIGDDEEDRLFNQMMALAADRERRGDLASRALQYVQTCHSPESVAAAYIAAIRRALE